MRDVCSIFVIQLSKFTCSNLVVFQYFWQALNIVEGLEMMNALMKPIHAILMTWKTGQNSRTTEKNRIIPMMEICLNFTQLIKDVWALIFTPKIQITG